MHKIYITGIAGFIGFHTAKKLSDEGYEVSGVDDFNDYYHASIKHDRATILEDEYGIKVKHGNLASPILNRHCAVIHLAAYAGVRHSLDNPQLYIDNNISATQSLIAECERLNMPVVYASSSSVMQGQITPWTEVAPIFGQLSNPYTWSKYINECQFASSKIVSAGLRFFTVYGPYGRPDMALQSFAESIIKGKTIDIYNYGDMQRDFTYVDDIVQGIQLVLENLLSQNNQHELYNIGSGKKNELMDYIGCLETELGTVAQKNYLPMHPADAKTTQANISKIQALGYEPTTNIEDGIKQFANWFKEYYVQSTKL
jgi:UDP-glucuronate 4-epimerase